jgi:hypothetical protein
MSMKNSSDAIGNRILDLPACSAVPQLTALRLHGVYNKIAVKCSYVIQCKKNFAQEKYCIYYRNIFYM